MDARLVGRVIDAARTVNPLLAVSATALDLKQTPASGSVRAQVAARLADGSFRVLIDGKALKLALPDDVKAGDVLQLRVVGRASAGPGAANPGTGATGVSSAGQLVADLVQEPTSAPVRQSTPVLTEPSDDPGALAAPLARAVERSGLFYESHQARWINGEFPLERLLEEPQAQTGKPQEPPRATPPSDGSPEIQPSPAPRPDPRADGDKDIDDVRQPALGAAPAAEEKTADKGNELLARETLPLVRQQLETLETRHFNWLGEVWPGQTMRWHIGEEPEGDPQGTAARHEWDSRFALDLPALGNVGAELLLSGNRLRVRISAADESTVAMMREYGRELVQALEAAGIEPSSFEVQHREPDL